MFKKVLVVFALLMTLLGSATTTQVSASGINAPVCSTYHVNNYIVVNVGELIPGTNDVFDGLAVIPSGSSISNMIVFFSHQLGRQAGGGYEPVGNWIDGVFVVDGCQRKFAGTYNDVLLVMPGSS